MLNFTKIIDTIEQHFDLARCLASVCVVLSLARECVTVPTISLSSRNSNEAQQQARSVVAHATTISNRVIRGRARDTLSTNSLLLGARDWKSAP